VNTYIVLFDSGSFLALISALIFLMVRNRALPSSSLIKSSLLLSVFFYAFISFSNILEHGNITAFFDPVEDIVEILFLFLFLFFIFAFRAHQNLIRVRNREDWLDSALESLYEGIIAVTRDGHVLYTNEKMRAMTGLSRSEALGRDGDELLDFMDKETQAPVSFAPFREFRNNGEAFEYPTGIYLRDRSNGLTLISSHVSEVKGKDGLLLGYIGSFYDVGPYFTIMEQLSHLQKMDAIGQLTSGVAHDLNNMLGGVLGAAELLEQQLKETKGGEGCREMLDIIFYSAENARELTANLLSFGRKGRIISTSVNMGEIVEKSVALARRTMDRRISIKIDLEDRDMMVSGDPAQLQNALLNLMINARDAQPEGGSIDILSRSRYLNRRYCDSSPYPLEEGEFIEVSICDRGPGIGKEIREKIFQPFFTTKEKGKGTGLGLAAVDSTVHSHGGALEIIDREGGGCCFHLLFPLIIDHSNRKPDGGRESWSHLKGRSVLVIDDEGIIRTTSRLMLEEEGLKCTAVGSGEEGLEKIRDRNASWDLVLLDVVMPGMGGEETATEIHREKPALPILFMSGFYRKEGLPLSVSGFLKKPFRKGELLQALEEAMKLIGPGESP